MPDEKPAAIVTAPVATPESSGATVQSATATPVTPVVVEPAVKADATESALVQTLLSDTEKASDASKTVEAEKTADGKSQDKTNAAADAAPQKEDDAQSVEPAQLPTYESFVLPEGVALDESKLGDFTKDLAEFETLTKADHAEMQKFGQKLVDKHVALMTDALKRVNEITKEQRDTQTSSWKEAFEKDPEIGGTRAEITVRSALEFIHTHGGTKEQVAEFKDLMRTTGVGNHPAMIRLLAKANSVLAEGKPLPATTPASAPVSKVAKRYGNTTK